MTTPSLSWDVVTVDKPDDLNVVIGQAHFNKTVEDLPNTTNPDDWARISGKKGERIVYIRTLVTGKSSSASRAIDTESNLGQYL